MDCLLKQNDIITTMHFFDLTFFFLSKFADFTTPPSPPFTILEPDIAHLFKYFIYDLI